MSLFILTGKDSAASNLIAELRDREIQKDRQRFRKNMELTGTLLAYAISGSLHYRNVDVETPLGVSRMRTMDRDPYLITILRAGIPFFEGFLDLFNRSESGFIGAYRSESDAEEQFNIEMGYTAVGNLDDRDVILADPMIATGKSIVKAVDYILAKGNPRSFHVAAVVAARQGYEYVMKNVDFPLQFWFGALDEDLNGHSYIVPGLGDAGDLCFGRKN